MSEMGFLCLGICQIWSNYLSHLGEDENGRGGLAVGKLRPDLSVQLATAAFWGSSAPLFMEKSDVLSKALVTDGTYPIGVDGAVVYSRFSTSDDPMDGG
jgi:hypothetical protein